MKKKMIYAIRDTRINKLVSVARPATEKNDINWKIAKWNRAVKRILDDDSNPYVLVSVNEGTKSETSHSLRPENHTGAIDKKKKTVKKKKVIKEDNTLKPIKEFTGPIRCSHDHITDQTKGNKCGCWIGSKMMNGEMQKILCSDTKRK